MSNAPMNSVPRDQPEETHAVFTPGTLIDRRYEIRRVIGAGSEGVVYEAIHRGLARRVALKVPSMLGPGQMADKRKRRLEREGRILASLTHPGVVRVLDSGTTSSGQPYLAMELLDGKTLETLLTTRGRLPVKDAVLLAMQLAETVASAHERGFLHRDIKPGNIMVVRTTEGERAKLLDFGVARSRNPLDAMDGYRTAEGSVIGTPAYMSTEQLMALPELDERTDVYSIGAVLFECLAGRVVYPGSYPAVLCAAHSAGPAPTVDAPLPSGLAAVVARAIAKARDERFATAAELAAALAPFCAGAALELLAAPAAEQRRRDDRVPFLGPVRLRSTDGAIDGRSEDLSRSGMLFFSRWPSAAGRSYEIRFVAPLSGRVVSTVGVARWVRERRDGGFAIGLEFVDPPARLTDEVDTFVRLMNQRATVEPDSSPLDRSSQPTLHDTPASRA